MYKTSIHRCRRGEKRVERSSFATREKRSNLSDRSFKNIARQWQEDPAIDSLVSRNVEVPAALIKMAHSMVVFDYSVQSSFEERHRFCEQRDNGVV